jgi:hypothetical protein
MSGAGWPTGSIRFARFPLASGYGNDPGNLDSKTRLDGFHQFGVRVAAGHQRRAFIRFELLIVSAERPKRKPAVRDACNRWYDVVRVSGGEAMAWDGDDLAGQAEEVFERQQAAADARAHRGTSTVEERARSAKFETLRLSRSRIMGQLSRATNPAHRTMLESALKSINDEMGEG